MVKKGKQKPQRQTKPVNLTLLDGVLIPLLFTLAVLIKIGDIIRWIFRALLRIRLPQLTLRKQKLKQYKILFKRPPAKPSWQGFILGIFFTLIFILLPYRAWLWLEKLPHPQLLSVRDIPVTTKIFDRHGFLLYEIYAEENRTPVTLAEIPQSLKQATMAIEDKEFYRHPGFSLRGILRAGKEIIFHHRVQGGSTITQQLVRSALLTPEPTISRKIKEIILSFWAERIYSKDQILEMYFNQVPYGGTAWGVEAASQTYFGKKVQDLNLAEAAYLAGLPASPSSYSPFGIHPELGLARQKEVLRRLQEDGYLTKEQKLEAETVQLVFSRPKTTINAPHFVMYVKDLLERQYGARLVQMGGLRVITTLDLPAQEMAQEIVTNEVKQLRSLKVSNGAVLITNPKTGEILAMVGSKDYFNLEEQGNVNVTLSLRQPGSAIKIVNYALALENGFTAATVLDDSPITFQVAGQPAYTPQNYDGKFHGKISLRSALANSYNVPAVKVLAKLGVGNMINQGRKMGITSWTDESRYGLSLTLGGGEVTMLDLARVYGTLADQGRKRDLTAILKVTDYKGQVWEEFRPQQGFPGLSPGIAFILTNILADNQARSAAFGLNSLLNIPGKTVAVKTGTTNDLRDNWAIGFTPSFLVAAWVGNNDNQPMAGIASGITGATPIWRQIMINLLKDKPDELILPTEEIIKNEVCGKSEYFLKGTDKGRVCPTMQPSPTPFNYF